jgi:cytochrome b561
MSVKSSPQRYGAIAASIHWLSALAVLLMLTSGLVMTNQPDLLPVILPMHVVLGLVVGVLTLFRVLWWVAFDKQPQPVEGMGRAQEWAARFVHLGLYGAIAIMVASGVAMLALTGAAPAIFSGAPLPDFGAVAPSIMHGLMSRILIALVVGHIGAALWHQLVRRDRLIARMGFGG